MPMWTNGCYGGHVIIHKETIGKYIVTTFQDGHKHWELNHTKG